MRLAAFLLITLSIAAAWALWLCGAPRRPGGGVGRGPARADSEVLVYAGLLTASQIVLTQILLGMLGWLRLPVLLGALLAVTVPVAGRAWLALRSGAGATPQTGWPQRRAAAREICGPANGALLVLATLLSAWVLAATWLLPPRGIDDLAYHLPPLFEAVQSGHLTLLPLEIRQQFAMPLGGDMLALWPLLFFHAATWIDAVQFAVAAFGVIVLYALARSLGAGRRDAAFAGLLFLFIPVVLGQAGSNYTDVTLAVCHLVLVYAVLRFWQTGALLHLAMAGLAGGFGFGTKYSMLVAIAMAQPLIALRLWRSRSLARGYAVFVLAALPLAVYWPVRNVLVTGFPLFPYELGLTGLKPLFDSAQVVADAPLGSAFSKLFEDPGRLLLYLFRDPGLGTLNGGLGTVFWGLGVPALAWCCYRALRAAAARDWFPALFWLQAPAVAVIYLLQTDVSRLAFNQRLLINVAGFGLLALAVLRARLRDAVPGAAPAIGLTGVLASALAVIQLAGYGLPSWQIRDAVAERRLGFDTSPYRYHLQATGDLPSQSANWDLLDYLTVDGAGWDVYLAAPWPVYWTTPAYGTRIQNRVWNFLASPGGDPDALVFNFGLSPGWDVFYPGRRITADQARADPRYALVNRTAASELWVLRQRLAEPSTRARLAEYQRRSAARSNGAQP